MDREEILQKLQKIIKDINKKELHLLHSIIIEGEDGGYEYREVFADDLCIIDSEDITPFIV